MTTYFDELVSIPCHAATAAPARDQRGLDQQHAFDDTVATALTTGEPLGHDRTDDEPGDGDEPGPGRARGVDQVRAGEDQRRGDVGGEHAEVQQAGGVHGPRRQHQEQHDAARGAVVGRGRGRGGHARSV